MQPGHGPLELFVALRALKVQSQGRNAGFGVFLNQLATAISEICRGQGPTLLMIVSDFIMVEGHSGGTVASALSHALGA